MTIFSLRSAVFLVAFMTLSAASLAHASDSNIISWRHNLMGVVAISSSDRRQNPYKDGATLTIRFVRGWDKLDARTREEKIQIIAWYAIGTNCALLRESRVTSGNSISGIAKCFPNLDYETFTSRYYPPIANS